MSKIHLSDYVKCFKIFMNNGNEFFFSYLYEQLNHYNRIYDDTAPYYCFFLTYMCPAEK